MRQTFYFFILCELLQLIKKRKKAIHHGTLTALGKEAYLQSKYKSQINS